MAEILPEIETFARIKVVGIGGGGGNALNRMVQSKLRGIDFVAINMVNKFRQIAFLM